MPDTTSALKSKFDQLSTGTQWIWIETTEEGIKFQEEYNEAVRQNRQQWSQAIYGSKPANALTECIKAAQELRKLEYSMQGTKLADATELFSTSLVAQCKHLIISGQSEQALILLTNLKTDQILRAATALRKQLRPQPQFVLPLVIAATSVLLLLGGFYLLNNLMLSSAAVAISATVSAQIPTTGPTAVPTTATATTQATTTPAPTPSPEPTPSVPTPTAIALMLMSEPQTTTVLVAAIPITITALPAAFAQDEGSSTEGAFLFSHPELTKDVQLKNGETIISIGVGDQILLLTQTKADGIDASFILVVTVADAQRSASVGQSGWIRTSNIKPNQ